jgi:predicted MPP superfamily phosphohydrolase
LSDLHYDPHFSAVPIARAVDLINGLKPDLIVVTGDFVTAPFAASRSSATQAAKMIEPCAQLLGPMQAPLGVYACLGNHDVATDEAHIAAVLESGGISVLRNRSIPLERNGARLWLGGLNDVLEGKYDLKQALKGVPKPEPVVMLVHEPDYAGYVKDVDLQLSGHSHGGQIRFPILGAPVLPVMGRRYPQGLRRIGPLTLYTNVGIGTIWLPMRLNCPPEVTLITLRASAV